jgi:hypothetical protein
VVQATQVVQDTRVVLVLDMMEVLAVQDTQVVTDILVAQERPASEVIQDLQVQDIH